MHRAAMEEFSGYVSGIPVFQVTMCKVYAQFFHHWDQQPMHTPVAASGAQHNGTSEYYQCLPSTSSSLIPYHQAQDSSFVLLPASSLQAPDGFVLSCVSPDCFQIAGVMDGRNVAGSPDGPGNVSVAFKPVGWVLDPAEVENDRKQKYVLWRTDDIVDSPDWPHEPTKNKPAERKEKTTVARHKTAARRTTSKCRETYSKVLQRKPHSPGLKELDVQHKINLKCKYMEKYNTKIFSNKSLISRNGNRPSEASDEAVHPEELDQDQTLSETSTSPKENENEESVPFLNKVIEFIAKHHNPALNDEDSDSSSEDVKFRSNAEEFVENEMCSVLIESLQYDITSCKPYSPSLRAMPVSGANNGPVLAASGTVQHSVEGENVDPISLVLLWMLKAGH